MLMLSIIQENKTFGHTSLYNLHELVYHLESYIHLHELVYHLESYIHETETRCYGLY